MAQDITENLKGKDILKQLTDQEFLSSIYGIGEKTVESMIDFFQSKHNLRLIRLLENYGVNMDPEKYSDLLKAENAK